MKHGRVIAALLAWPLLAVGVVGLVVQEPQIEPGIPQGRAVVASKPVLASMQFTAPLRRENFSAMGLSGAALDTAMRSADQLDRRKDEMMAGLKAASVDGASPFLCSVGPLVYLGSAVVLDGEGSELRVRAPTTSEPWRRWVGFDARVVQVLYREWEGRSSRRPEDTAMALIALLSGHAPEALLTGTAEWNRKAETGGSLPTTMDRSPRAAAMLPEYVATVHVLAEIVQADVKRWGCGAVRAADVE